jgi:hypothetical protein
MIAGTKAQTVIAIIEKTPLKLRNTVSDITLDGSKHGIDCQCFLINLASQIDLLLFFLFLILNSR